MSTKKVDTANPLTQNDVLTDSLGLVNDSILDFEPDTFNIETDSLKTPEDTTGVFKIV